MQNGLEYKLYFALEWQVCFYRHTKQNAGKADLDLLDPSVKLNKMNMYNKFNVDFSM